MTGEQRDALPPERCVDPDDLFPELERRNRGLGVRSSAEEEVEAFR